MCRYVSINLAQVEKLLGDAMLLETEQLQLQESGGTDDDDDDGAIEGPSPSQQGVLNPANAGDSLLQQYEDDDEEQPEGRSRRRQKPKTRDALSYEPYNSNSQKLSYEEMKGAIAQLLGRQVP